jgi:hypothetical protein
MELIQLKKVLYTKCIEKQNDIVEAAYAAMDEAQRAANEYGPPKDRYDSFRTQLLRKRDLFAEQHDKAMRDLVFLQTIKPESTTSVVDINSLVITNNQRFYVSIGLGRIELSEGEFYVISPVAPIYKALRGKMAGESVLFNGQRMEIIAVV